MRLSELRKGDITLLISQDKWVADLRFESKGFCLILSKDQAPDVTGHVMKCLPGYTTPNTLRVFRVPGTRCQGGLEARGEEED